MASTRLGLTEIARRLRGKSAPQLLRSTCMRVWPISVATRAYYRRLFGARADERRNLPLRAAHVRLSGDAALDPAQRRMLESLRHEGICVTTLEELFADATLFPRLREEARRLLDEPAVRQVIREGQTAGGRRWGSKWYVVRALGWQTRLRLSPVLQELFVHDRLLAVVNAYLGLCSRLTYADLWYNIPARDGEPEVASEHWHRDQEDRRVVKLYLYLEDVDASMGPLHYMRRTHGAAEYAHLFPPRYPQGSYPPEDDLARAVPAELTTVCAGKAGTVVLCDTFGFHKGGRSTTEPRVLFTSVYASNLVLDFVRYEPGENGRPLSAPAQFALRLR